MTRHLLSIFFLCAMTVSSVTQSADPIRIGTTQSLTGQYSEFGVEQLRGLQMWATDVNVRGALLGRPVEIVYYDDASTGAGTVAGFTKLLKQDDVDFLVGPYSSSLTLEASLVAEAFNTPMISAAASSEKIWNRGLKNIFGADTPANDYMQGLQIAVDAGAQTIALIYARTEFGEEVAASVRDNAAATIVLDEGYPPEQREFRGLAKRLSEANADVIIGISYFEDSVEVVRALKIEGVKPKMLGFTAGPGLRKFKEQLGPDAEGVVGVVQWLRSSKKPGAQDFAYRFSKRYGYNPGVYAVIGYSAGEILEAAVRLANTVDHDAVREQLNTMYFRALIGPYDVDDTGRQIGRTNYVLQWQDDRRRLIAPENASDADLIYPLQ
ncbi:MAG: amino acid ABC transporter substrate-binding protein [Halioglobus sp.]|nr:amino acid ABC transporter substrate-binding protein [Halioglobus sp.]